MKLDSPTMLSILTTYGIDIAQEIKYGKNLKGAIETRIKELTHHLENNGDADFEFELKILNEFMENCKK